MPIKYFKATDGVFTVFRASKTRNYTHSTFHLTTGGQGVAQITFSEVGGSFRAEEIVKSEYDHLLARKVSRLSAINYAYPNEPSQSWIKNTSL